MTEDISIQISNDGNTIKYCNDIYVKQNTIEDGKILMYVDGNKVLDMPISDIVIQTIDPLSQLNTEHIISLLRESKCVLYDEVHIYDDGSIMLGHGRTSKLKLDDINMIKKFLLKENEKLTNKKINAYPEKKHLPIKSDAFHQVVYNICQRQFEVPVESKKE